MPAETKKEKAAARPDGQGRALDRTTELSERVLQQIRESQESAIEAVRKFVESVDDALPPHGDGPSRRQEIVDSALEMSEKLVRTQYDFLTNIVRGAGEALGARGEGGTGR